MSRCAKLIVAILLSVTCVGCLIKLCVNLWDEINTRELNEVDLWLDQNNLSQYKEIFKSIGKNYFIYKFFDV